MTCAAPAVITPGKVQPGNGSMRSIAPVARIRRWPRTVIVKKSNRGGGHIFTEWAALSFLAGCETLRGIAPRLYGGDRVNEMLVLEDVGRIADRRLRHVLEDGSPDDATRALVAAHAAAGRLNAATLAGRSAHANARRALPSPASLDFHQVGRLTEGLIHLPDSFGCLGERRCGPAVREIAEVIVLLAHPGPFGALTHGDLCPSNIATVDGCVRLLDFEVSGFRHALLDGAYARLRHLNCFDGHRIPESVQRQMEAAYRTELSRTCAAAGDDVAYARGLAAACAAWMAVTLLNVPRVLERDKPRGAVSFRQRILASLEEFERASRELHAFPHLGATTRRVARHLRLRWSDAAETLDVFPAFRSR